MKHIKYLFPLVALLFTLSACTVESEDVFSTAPVAPEMYVHDNILMTSNTMSEDVNFSWKPARFAGESVNYVLVAVYDGSEAELGSTADLYYKKTKSDFKDLIYSKFQLPQNNTFPMSFYVKAVSESVQLKSGAISIDVYAYGDAVSPENTASVSTVVLDPSDPMGEAFKLNWEAARLGYNEEITYNVVMRYGEGAWYQLAAEISAPLEYVLTVDVLNEACVACLGPEGQAADYDFAVNAISKTYPEGIISNAVTVNVTTYIATFPDQIYLPGSHQGWDPETATTIPQSASIKGYYEGVIDLRNADGVNTEFKFSPVPKWEGDFSIENIVLSTFGEGYTAVRGHGVGSVNISVPSGLYNISLNKKFNTLYMVQIDVLSMIGEAVGGWETDVDMVYDPVAKTFTGETDMVGEKEFKIRTNHNWDHSIGTNGGELTLGSFTNAGNFIFNRATSHYKVVLHVAQHPYFFTFVDTNFPERVYVVGDHQGWSPEKAPVLEGNGEGQYEGYCNLNESFKFTSAPDWNHTNYGGALEALSTDGGAGNLVVPAPGYYRLVLDLSTMSAVATAITRVGVIGSFSSWAEPDMEMTYDAENDIWHIEGLEFAPGAEYKFRMNDKWDINLGGDVNNLTQDGANITAVDGGMVNLTLKISTTPYKSTIEYGSIVKPQYGTVATLAGDYSGHGWDVENDPHLYGKGDGKFTGVVSMFNSTYGFKIVDSGNWIAGNLVEGTTYEYNLYEGENMTIPNGTYYWNIDLVAKKALAMPVTSMGIMGSFAGSEWSTEVPMTFDETTLKYTATITVAAGDGFKFRINNNWDYVLGGDITTLTTTGDNINIAEGGTYLVTLDLANTASASLVQQ